MRVTLKQSCEEWIVVVPEVFIKQHQLKEGDVVYLQTSRQLEGIAKRTCKYTLSELLAEMPDEIPRVPGWEEMPSMGRELD